MTLDHISETLVRCDSSLISGLNSSPLEIEVWRQIKEGHPEMIGTAQIDLSPLLRSGELKRHTGGLIPVVIPSSSTPICHKLRAQVMLELLPDIAVPGTTPSLPLSSSIKISFSSEDLHGNNPPATYLLQHSHFNTNTSTLSLQHSHFNPLTSTLSLQHSHFNALTSTL